MEDYKTKEYNVEDNTTRVAKLPEEYIAAMETIVDNLDKDWKNKVVNAKYVAYLCDLFEDAVSHGKSVNQVIGDDPIAYARKLQSEVDFRDLEPTQYNKLTNTFLSANLIFLFAFNFMNPIVAALLEGKKLDLFVSVIGVVAVVLLITGIIVKQRKMALINMSILVTLIECALVEVIAIPFGLSQMGVLIGFLVVTVFDYALVYRKMKN